MYWNGGTYLSVPDTLGPQGSHPLAPPGIRLRVLGCFWPCHSPSWAVTVVGSGQDWAAGLLLLLLSCFSCVWLCATPEMAAHQALLSLGFSRQEHWSGLPFPSPMHESEKWKWSRTVSVRLFVTPWTTAYQTPPSMGFSRQEYWSGLPLPSPEPQSSGALFFKPQWWCHFPRVWVNGRLNCAWFYKKLFL